MTPGSEWPGEPPEGWPDDPYDEDGYCEFCGNGRWKYHAPWCGWADAQEGEKMSGTDPLEALIEEVSPGVAYTLERLRTHIGIVERDNQRLRGLKEPETEETLLAHHAWHHERYRNRPNVSRALLDHPHSEWPGGEPPT